MAYPGDRTTLEDGHKSVGAFAPCEEATREISHFPFGCPALTAEWATEPPVLEPTLRLCGLLPARDRRRGTSRRRRHWEPASQLPQPGC
jgi:hypothetical protein